ncbi:MULTISPECIES: heavy metal-responsive transcriptional regulator [Mycobacteriaceae]|uniref:Mercuric resistance operon regulatory protein n=2 Tax=Mycobacteroides TaxID=670516 RepID=A0A4R8QUJ2_9MYCO|nr:MULTISPECIES: heavy metal-responsive transcriptional regulator [Mycobacteriaceae]AMT69442.1 MerR family transcriptional regulator [Mycobacteroides immunogenum]ANO02481.1 heavy metal-responsive transcriptional regulator [Mycobacteroides immunogenum]KIU38725.1 MerR family transcriptional regulator [Mycobacteroides immunogenum]KPG08595.1 MerR family transcriptional regulator [Mycobacteroides immunogenum]KPG08848.1 MerR family transcriptional regulator [Mycobacteroides immunogenum]
MRIGQLAEATGTTAATLRYYEDEGLLPPAERTPAGYRQYGGDAIARVGFIHRGQAAGLTLAQIRQILTVRDSGHAPCTHVRELLGTRLADLDEQISILVALRATIARLREQADTVDPGSCNADDVCRYL